MNIDPVEQDQNNVDWQCLRWTLDEIAKTYFEAGRRQGMIQAENIALEVNDGHDWPVSRRILAARDAQPKEGK